MHRYFNCDEEECFAYFLFLDDDEVMYLARERAELQGWCTGRERHYCPAHAHIGRLCNIFNAG